jgi:ribosomal-protein-alanine N-acetyltransferase
MVDQSQINIRNIGVKDLSNVMEVERLCYPIPWSESVFKDSVTGSNECWLFEYQGVLCGHAVVSNILDEVHLLNICIAPRFNRKGLGRVLLKHLISTAVERNASVFFLEVRVSNRSAIDLYFSEGFNEVGVRPNYYPSEVGAGREDALLMTLELSVDYFS